MDFPESVVDFLKSTSFNDDIVVLERESHAAGRLAEVIAREDSADRNGNQSEYKLTPRQAENAARVALLLTRAFVDFGAQHMVTVELDNFFITSKSLGQRPALSDHHSQADGSIPPRSACAPPEHAGSSSEDAVQQKQGTDNVANDLKVILGIHVLFPTIMPDQERQQSQNGPAIPLQILGGLLYSIFTGGSLLTDTTFIENDVISDGDSSSKNRRTEGKSLFSRLSGGELFPTAICRLLSDLIDTDPSGKADSPYKSIPEVSEDLENLVDHPSIFLHDAQCPDGHWQPVFGNMLNGREEEIAAILKISTTLEQSLQKSYVGCPKFGVESIWLSGIAGAGKTHLVEAAGNFLTSVGWIFIKVKFERRKEHGSRAIFLSAFDELIIHVLKTKTKKDSADSSKKETFFSRVSNFIMKAIGQDTLKVLAGLLPSLKEMYNIDRKKRYRRDAEMPSWQLIYCLTKLLESVLESETFIMICFDDLQWADQTSLDLLKSIMSNVGNLKNSSRRCLFVGLFREDEVSDKHHLAIQRKNMQNSDNSVKVTDIKVSSLTRGHVEDMVMRGLRLPRRLVVGLADLVQKKTSGLPLFVVQFLNSLVKESIIVYSPTKRRYTWDEDRIDLIQTGDSVANLIASNLSSLPQLSQEALQILACFGMQTDSNLLRILEAPGSGFCGVTSSLRSLIDLGIIDEAGPIIRFTHDLIQQEVYENIPLDQRKALHLKLGNLLGSEAEADIDSSPDTQQATFDMDQLRLNDTFFAGRSMCSSLISIACDQINVSGPGLTNGDDQREKFIRWNLWAGQKSYRMSDYRAAMFYFSKGIDFIGVESWFRDTQCSNYRVYLQLHEGAVLASYELGKIDLRYANAVTDNVPFNDSLVVEQVLLKSISLQSGKHSECISKGVEILRKLGLDIPLSPTMSSVMNVVASTDIMTSRFDLEGIKTMCDEGADDSTRAILAIWDSFYVSAHVSNSPYLPLIACEVVKYSLEHKSICLESCTAFATYGVIKVAMGGNYAAGQKWAEVSRAIVKKTMEPDGSASNPKCDLILVRNNTNGRRQVHNFALNNLLPFCHKSMRPLIYISNLPEISPKGSRILTRNA
ncbi:hypothetical protein ACHAWF_008830 [Thalassiosira exigua]